jgi:hypothetical protein
VVLFVFALFAFLNGFLIDCVLVAFVAHAFFRYGTAQSLLSSLVDLISACSSADSPLPGASVYKLSLSTSHLHLACSTIAIWILTNDSLSVAHSRSQWFSSYR